MLMYRVKWQKIEPIEVLRTTEKQVRYRDERGNEQREAKETGWYTWHETWEEAHARIVADAQKKVDGLRLQLERANGALGNAKGMKPANGLSSGRAGSAA